MNRKSRDIPSKPSAIKLLTNLTIREWSSLFAQLRERFGSTADMKITDHLYLFTVADRFTITGRGTVIVPGIPHSLKDPPVRRGAPLILRTPLGDIVETYLRDIEMISYRPGAKRLEATPILLPDLHKFDIPIGTEVYLRQPWETITNHQGRTRSPQPTSYGRGVLSWNLNRQLGHSWWLGSNVRPTNSAMPDLDKKPSRLVIPLEDVVATLVAIGVLGGITYLILLWLRWPEMSIGAE